MGVVNIVFFFTYGYSLETWERSGTLERELKTLKSLTKNYGHKFTLITYGDSKDLEINSVKKYFDVIPIYSLIKRNKNKNINYIKSFIIPFKLKKLLKKTDFVHQHQLLGSWVVLLIKLIYRKPILIRTGYDMYLFAKKESKSKTLIFLYKVLTYLSLKFSDIYTVTSKCDFDFLKNNFKKVFKNVLIRPNFVDQNNFVSINEREPNKILSVGRLVEQKNFKLLISEFSNTYKYLEIDIVGEGDLKEEILTFANSMNVKINLLGKVQYEDLLKIYNQYIFFISTSLFEGNPKSILEAMASGCVVIASNIDNHSELINNKESGYLFDFEKPEILNLYNKLRDQKKQLETVSNAAMREVIKKNSLEKISKEIHLDYLRVSKS